MPSVLRVLVGLALFIGVGFGAPYCYQQWMVSAVNEASAAGLKETSTWKAVEGNFSNVKFDQPVYPVPKIDFSRPPTYPPKR